ncbi:MAG: hypothetical protein ACTHKP_16170 [Nitrososphaeraceae archaeon]
MAEIRKRSDKRCDRKVGGHGINNWEHQWNRNFAVVNREMLKTTYVIPVTLCIGQMLLHESSHAVPTSLSAYLPFHLPP